MKILMVILVTATIACILGCREICTVSIPHGHNIDSITVKDGYVTEVKTHKRDGSPYIEKANTPRELPVIIIKENKQAL